MIERHEFLKWARRTKYIADANSDFKIQVCIEWILNKRLILIALYVFQLSYGL